MSVQSMTFLWIVFFVIISRKQNIAQEIMTDIFTVNITVEWNTSHIMTCGNQTEMYVELFQCQLPTGYLVVLDKSCLYNKTFDFNNASCPVTTTRPVTAIPPVVTTRPSKSNSSLFECEDKNFIGRYCNITNSPCINPQLCVNDGNCSANNTLPHGYVCQCSPGYTGENCEFDDRVCKNNTCWHNGICTELHKIVALVNQTTFDCDCQDGYNGLNCESSENMCTNITCQNRGICFSSYPSWTCVCAGSSLYYGTYCEYESTALVVRKVLSKSFASIAIAAIVSLFLFVIIMDVLKYGFKIDPVDRERRWMKKLARDRKRKKKKKKKDASKRNKQTKTALQFYYIP